MPRTAAKFTQADIARALRAVAQTRSEMAVEVLPDGTIRLVPYEKRDYLVSKVKPKIDEKPLIMLS